MNEKNTPTSNTQNTPNLAKLIQEFHHTYSMPIRSFDNPTLFHERLGTHMSLITERLAELMGAVYDKRTRVIIEAATAKAIVADDGECDVIGTVNVFADLVCAVYGIAIGSGMNLGSMLTRIQASNFSKLISDNSVELRGDGEIFKSPNFFPPSVVHGLDLEIRESASNAG